MARLDSGTFFDSGARFDEERVPVPNQNQRTKAKRMKRQHFFPSQIGEQIVRIRNYSVKVPNHETELGLDSADVVAQVLDASNAIYGLETYRGAAAAFGPAATQRLEEALFSANPSNIG